MKRVKISLESLKRRAFTTRGRPRHGALRPQHAPQRTEVREGQSAPSSRPPNILVIVTDQERSWRWLESLMASNDGAASYNSESDANVWDMLPGRALLQANGVRFDNYHVTTAPCSPSRSSLYTGHHAPRTQIVDNMDLSYQGSMDRHVWTIADALNEIDSSRFYAAYKGKVHLARDEDLSSEEDMFDLYGFRDWQGPAGTHDFEGPLGGYYLDRNVLRYGLSWLDEVATGLSRSWLLSLDFINPHDIMLVDADGCDSDSGRPEQRATGRLFPLSGVPEDAPYDNWWLPPWQDGKPSWIPYAFDEADETISSRPSAHSEFAGSIDVAFGEMDYDQTTMVNIDGEEVERYLWEVYINYYINCMVDVDQQVYQVVSRFLDPENDWYRCHRSIAENTLLVFVSDHGDMAHSHRAMSYYDQQGTYFPEGRGYVPLRQKGPLIYSENLNVPLIIASANRTLIPQPGTATPALASGIDIVPTLLDYLGVRSRYTSAYKAYINAQQLTGATRSRIETLTTLRGVSLRRVIENPTGYTQPAWSDGTGNGRSAVLFTYDAVSTLSAAVTAKAATSSQEQVRFALSTADPDIRKRRGFIRGMFDGRRRYGVYFDYDAYSQWANGGVPSNPELELYLDGDEIRNQKSDTTEETAARTTLLQQISAELPRPGETPASTTSAMQGGVTIRKVPDQCIEPKPRPEETVTEASSCRL